VKCVIIGGGKHRWVSEPGTALMSDLCGQRLRGRARGEQLFAALCGMMYI